MKDSLRLIVILIVAAGIGIVVVLGSWLYGSYNQRMELFLATAERALFDAIQETIQQQEDTHEQPKFRVRRAIRPAFAKKLIATLTTTFPGTNPDSLYLLLDRLQQHEHDSLLRHRADVIGVQAGSPFPSDGPRRLLPSFLFGQTPLDSAALLNIRQTFMQELKRNHIRTDFTLNVIEAPPHRHESVSGNHTAVTLLTPEARLLDGMAGTGFSIRPLLIDPENGKFISASFNHPWQYLLYSLSWQLIISVALVATIVGCFIYLFHTIFKQNKLAMLRKAFVNNMTHEFRTPIATVSAAVQALQSYADTKDEERRDLYLSISREELDHLSSLIDSVLEIAEGEHHSIVLHCRPYNLTDLIKKCIATAEINARTTPVDFHFITAHAIENLYGDPEHMKNVVTNLLDNAVKYHATQVSIVIQPPNAGKFVQLSVSDNGIGIPRAYHRRIFEPFFRVPRSNVHAAKGFGLGLSYVKQVVQQHGGSIALDSTPGEGCVFTLFIPKNAKV
ncbi:sensor histidine kinase [Parapedobacter sp. GCM10030251]|uniref:sensor histidine kinase n=1 Tax=Parapedobacter sp. GCM10030251 TaxID=3273419 RepID=UPI003609B451